MNKRDVIIQIGKLEENHCTGCKLIKTFKETMRINGCVTKCDVGKQIRALGKQLENGKNNEIRIPKYKKITKEMYLEFKEQGHTDKTIYHHLNISHATLYRLKREWGLVVGR